MKIVFWIYVGTIVIGVGIGLITNILGYFALIKWDTGLAVLGYVMSACAAINLPCAIILGLKYEGEKP